MKNLINRLMKRSVSTQRVDDMANSLARTALDNRVNRILAIHAAAGLPTPASFPALSNPIQNQRVS